MERLAIGNRSCGKNVLSPQRGVVEGITANPCTALVRSLFDGQRLPDVENMRPNRVFSLLPAVESPAGLRRQLGGLRGFALDPIFNIDRPPHSSVLY